MPLQNNPPAKNTRSQRNQALLTPTVRAPLDCTPSAHQLSENLDRGPPMEGEEPFREGGMNLQDLMDITLELDTRYHERQKEKGSHKEKKPPVTGSNSLRPPQDSSSKKPHHKDEVFKEIKEFGEFFAISLLDVFQGDMDLHHLPFHASLEEQWDDEEEPEEIEDFPKVVPPANHHYLDVFSKVKAEKLPPHHACDHHIKLEGILPPAGFMYSLSNNES
ncbi:hypothetical protein O181_065564 [Austropuccinia psidii MF-1]|uniref:Uncharacterized protein n=1 Tax=Austropuccinia psidii MF-1 TaxID=1389203 RepID=A0A9Q3I4N7_9BASI|nr:hypothetical protein [Austropuccinia psidii MF-1]